MTVVVEKLRRGYRLTESVRIPRQIDEVFSFFASAHNLNEITPPSLRFRILTPAPIEMRTGALIDYRIRVRGVPVSWRTEITDWDPPYGFADRQLRGPYRWWIHRHTFEDLGDSVVMTDMVDYGVPGGPLAHALLVKRDVTAIFRYRTYRMGELFGAESIDAEEVSSPRSMRSGSRARPAC